MRCRTVRDTQVWHYAQYECLTWRSHKFNWTTTKVFLDMVQPKALG
jgi:hypothetical protein